MPLTTLCYIEDEGRWLMMHRIKKKNDINHDKWIGIGGHFEEDESPEECLLREVREETGLILTSWRYRGIVVMDLNLWEGDRIFLRLLEEEQPFFSLKLVYDENDRLTEALLNGRRV